MTRAMIMTPRWAVEPELIAAVESWRPRGPERPSIALEVRADGLRVRLTYLGVESGVLFGWGSWGTARSVQATLDRVFDVLSWRVVRPPE